MLGAALDPTPSAVAPRDLHIRMWNLLKGKCSYTAKLEVEGEVVQFAPGGESYSLLCGNKVSCPRSRGALN